VRNAKRSVWQTKCWVSRMVVRMVFARRRPRGWNRRVFQFAHSVVSLQESMWQNVLTAWRSARNAAREHPEEGTSITLTMKSERESPTSDIEFCVVDISNTFVPGVEQKEFENCLSFFQKYGVFRNLLKRMDATRASNKGFFGKPLKSKFFSVDALKMKYDEFKKKGEEEIGEDSLAVTLLKFGIMSHVDKYDSLEKAERAFVDQENEMIQKTTMVEAPTIKKIGEDEQS